VSGSLLALKTSTVSTPSTLALSFGPPARVNSPSSACATDQTASCACASQMDCCTCRNAAEPGGLAPSTMVSTAPSTMACGEPFASSPVISSSLSDFHSGSQCWSNVR
jgi:hypothetical protein